VDLLVTLVGVTLLFSIAEVNGTLARFTARAVRLCHGHAGVLVVGELGVSLVVGKGPVEQKLLMAARVLGKVRAKGELPKVVFLDNEAHPERVVVRLR
jgi:cell division protein FtsQ